jgi:hypothetical protein
MVASTIDVFPPLQSFSYFTNSTPPVKKAFVHKIPFTKELIPIKLKILGKNNRINEEAGTSWFTKTSSFRVRMRDGTSQ